MGLVAFDLFPLPKGAGAGVHSGRGSTWPPHAHLRPTHPQGAALQPPTALVDEDAAEDALLSLEE